jgi:hypothetical protein
MANQNYIYSWGVNLLKKSEGGPDLGRGFVKSVNTFLKNAKINAKVELSSSVYIGNILLMVYGMTIRDIRRVLEGFKEFNIIDSVSEEMRSVKKL